MARMKNIYLDLLERLAALEHEQWVHWARAVSEEVSEERRKRWEKYFVPYDQLPEDVKKSDREWANKAIKIFIEWFDETVGGLKQ